jgi:hypothetical protein
MRALSLLLLFFICSLPFIATRRVASNEKELKKCFEASFECVAECPTTMTTDSCRKCVDDKAEMDCSKWSNAPFELLKDFHF